MRLTAVVNTLRRINMPPKVSQFSQYAGAFTFHSILLMNRGFRHYSPLRGEKSVSPPHPYFLCPGLGTRHLSAELLTASLLTSLPMITFCL